MPSQQQEVVPHRGLITVCAMLATLMQSLDSHDRKRCVALYAGQFVREFGSDHLGAHLLHHRGGDHDRAGGLAVGPVRSEKPVSDLDDRLHRGVDAVRHRRIVA